MSMNRRNVLVGLGTIVAGGGAALGTGAFSSVEADRTVNVNVEGDANAFLGLSAATTGASNYVDESGDAIVIDIGTAGTDGVNADAKTKFSDLVDITNNGTNNVNEIRFSLSGTNSPNNAITVLPGDFLGSNNDFPGSNDTVLENGESVTFGLEIDLTDTGGTEADLDGVTLTIKANTA